MNISVLMPVYNGEEYLKEAIDSVLNQTYKHFEFIIVNDGSIDNSEKIILAYNDKRIKYIKRDNGGLSAALNTGLFVAKGEYIARMDADDISFPDRFEKQLAYLKLHPNIVVLGGGITYIEKDGNPIFSYVNKRDAVKIRENILESCPISHPTVMFNREVALQCGGYYEKIKQHFEDHLLFKKMLKYGDLYNLQEPLLFYRLVPTSITSNKSYMGEYLKIRNRTLINGFISDNDRDRLFEIKTHNNSNQEFKQSKYHLYLAKLYLWRNPIKNKSRENFLKSLKLDFSYKTLFLYILTYLPSNFVMFIYDYLNRNRIK